MAETSTHAGETTTGAGEHGPTGPKPKSHQIPNVAALVCWVPTELVQYGRWGEPGEMTRPATWGTGPPNR